MHDNCVTWISEDLLILVISFLKCYKATDERGLDIKKTSKRSRTLRAPTINIKSCSYCQYITKLLSYQALEVSRPPSIDFRK